MRSSLFQLPEVPQELPHWLRAHRASRCTHVVSTQQPGVLWRARVSVRTSSPNDAHPSAALNATPVITRASRALPAA